MPRADLVCRWVALRREVATHKAAIGQHRRQLHVAAAALADVEAEARASGIQLVTITTAGEGDRIHGRPQTATA